MESYKSIKNQNGMESYKSIKNQNGIVIDKGRLNFNLPKVALVL